MTDRPIIFSTPMVQALLAGCKTMTRRLAWKPGWNLAGDGELPEKFTDPRCDEFLTICSNGFEGSLNIGAAFSHKPARWPLCFPNGQDEDATCTSAIVRRKPSPWQKVQPGDRLYVRENFFVQQVNRHWELIDGKGTEIISACIDYEADGLRTWVKRDADDMPKVLTVRKNRKGTTQAKMLPNIHLPEMASRLTLIVEAVKVEPLQDISERDAVAEGVQPFTGPMAAGSAYGMYRCLMPDGKDHFDDSACRLFAALWSQLHGPESWDANPDVVALTFRVIHQNIDQIEVTV